MFLAVWDNEDKEKGIRIASKASIRARLKTMLNDTIRTATKFCSADRNEDYRPPLSIGGNVNLFPNRELLLASFPAMQPTLGAWQLVTNSGRSLCESMPCQRYWKQIRNIQNSISNWGVISIPKESLRSFTRRI